MPGSVDFWVSGITQVGSIIGGILAVVLVFKTYRKDVREPLNNDLDMLIRNSKMKTEELENALNKIEELRKEVSRLTQKIAEMEEELGNR